MSQMKIRGAIFAAILIVAAAGVAGALDYSSALGENGQLGLGEPPMAVIKAGPFPVPDLGVNITNAVIPSGDRFGIGNFRNVPALSRQTLENIAPVPERKPLG